MTTPLFYVSPEHKLAQMAEAIVQDLKARGFTPADVVNVAGILAAHALAHVPPANADEAIMVMEEAVRQNAATIRGVLLRPFGGEA